MPRLLLLVVLAEAAVLVVLGALLLGPTPDTPLPEGIGASRPGESVTPAEAEPREAAPAASARRPADLGERRAAIAPWNPDDAVGVLVHGTVRDRDGEPIAGAYVHFLRAPARSYGSTAASGEYSLAGLAPGDWTASARAENHAPRETVVTLDERTFQRADFTLDPTWVVKVRIQTPAGEDLTKEWRRIMMSPHGPHVVATEEPLAGDLGLTENSSVISFGIGDWRSDQGELHLHGPPPAHAHLTMRHVVLASQRIAPEQRELTFTLEAKDLEARLGAVRLLVKDAASGEPLPDVNVSLNTAQGGGGGTKTGADGRVELRRVVPGLLALELRAKDREWVTTYVKVRPGETLDLGELTLGAGIKAGGRVLGPDGKPAPARVQWTDLRRRRFPQPMIDRRSALADAEGRFELWMVGRSVYSVSALDQRGNRASGLLDLTSGSAAPLELRLSQATAVELTADFPPTTSYTVTVMDRSGNVRNAAHVRNDRLGHAMRLLAGDYTFEIHDQDDRFVRRFPVTIAGAAMRVDVP
jgi:hypothetical protein